jgi:hypothetical protein
MKQMVVLLVFGLFIASNARADHYRAGDLEKLMAVPNWELVRQRFNAVSGEKIGAPVLVRRYDTLSDCDKAQQGRISRVRNAGVKWVGTFYVCRHKDADEV